MQFHTAFVLIIVVWTLGVIGVPISSANAPLTPTVVLPEGVINGNARDTKGVLSFLGIPYATPPLGLLRWASPQPVSKYSGGVVNATQFSNSCWASAPEFPAYAPPSEDCLYINVWTSAKTANDKLPVMVWIYGGGFQFGAASDIRYNGANMAAEGVVLVSFNYRVNVFGFLALSELDTEVKGHNSGNFGIQDQILALKWVEANIAAFGGDPTKVTIFGQSAGAHSVGILMASPLASGLFRAGIMESGAWWDDEHGSMTNFDQARQIGQAFEQALGASSVAELRAMPAVAVNAANQWNVDTDPCLTSFTPSIDDYVLMAAPGNVFTDGKQAKIPLMTGWVADEQAIFLGRAPPDTTTSAYEADLQGLFGNKLHQALALYPDTNLTTMMNSAGTLDGDLIIREQTWEAADKQYSVAHQPTFVYYFTYTSLYSPVAFHTAEIPFVFGNLGVSSAVGGPSTPVPSAADIAMSQVMMSYWTNFAKTGNPNGAKLPTWPAYNSVNGQVLLLGNNIEAYSYNFSAFKFIESFRTNGVLPAAWRNVDPDN